ncbi:MAG: ATP-binding protein [Deltaproteobacteria bacterium]|nr:ATP-binding protein [Deltaproteobacteria bacterium]
MNKRNGYRSLYLPAWTIVAAVIILLAVIAVSTYRNMSRETGRMEDSLLREGLVIVRAIEAGVRADDSLKSPDAGHLQKLIEEVAREPEVASIAIFDERGKVVAANRLPLPDGEPIREAASLRLLLKEKGVITRYRPNQNGEAEAFEIILPFRPYNYDIPSRFSDSGSEVEKEPLRRWAGDKMITLGLKLASFETARQQDRHHTLLMAAILLVLGTGALFFIFVVQNYYLVHRTLGRMRTYMENVVESMADGLVSVDREGRIVTLNRQAGDILGAGPAFLSGKKIKEILGEQIGNLLLTTDEQPLVRVREIEFSGKQGGKIPLSVSVAPLKGDDGQEMGAVLLIRDLREIRALQEKVARGERLASLGRLAAGMAHEIRNPLSSIRGFAQYFAKRFSGQAEEQGYALVMVKEVDRLNRVITDLLDFARPKEPRREVCLLESIAEQALNLLDQDLKSRKVVVTKHYEADLPTVLADRDQITQVFLNLLLNAMESMPEGGEIRIGMSRVDAPLGAEILIADRGEGIPEEDLNKVFDPFFSRKRKGTGLGLAIVHQIVTGHGGEIGVESRPGEGTRFRFRLPSDRSLKNGEKKRA